MGGQWIPAAAIADHPTIPNTLIAKTDFHQVQACNEQWHQKVAAAAKAVAFQMITATIREADPSITSTLLNSLQGIPIASMSLNHGAVNSGNASQQLKTTLQQITQTQSDLTKALASKVSEESKDKEIKAKQDNIHAAAVLAQLFGSVAFSGDPTAAYRINTTIRGLETITDNVINLGKLENVGQKIVAA